MRSLSLSKGRNTRGGGASSTGRYGHFFPTDCPDQRLIVGGPWDAGGMTNPTLTDLAEAVTTALPIPAVDGLTDDDLLTAAQEAEALGRRVDALRVAIAGSIQYRSRTEV